MPTNRTRLKRARSGSTKDLPEHIYQAFTGAGFGYLAGLDGGWKKQQTERQLRAAWKKHRDAILERDRQRNQERKRIARRPWPYWKWEIEPKHPRLQTGLEECVWPCGPGHTPGRITMEPVYESNCEYLHRLGLLEKWEQELMKRPAPAADEPEIFVDLENGNDMVIAP